MPVSPNWAVCTNCYILNPLRRFVYSAQRFSLRLLRNHYVFINYPADLVKVTNPFGYTHLIWDIFGIPYVHFFSLWVFVEGGSADWIKFKLMMLVYYQMLLVDCSLIWDKLGYIISAIGIYIKRIMHFAQRVITADTESLTEYKRYCNINITFRLNQCRVNA